MGKTKHFLELLDYLENYLIEYQIELYKYFQNKIICRIFDIINIIF